jgi:hypothetical protein
MTYSYWSTAWLSRPPAVAMPVFQVASCVRAAVDTTDFDVRDALMDVAETQVAIPILLVKLWLPQQLKYFNFISFLVWCHIVISKFMQSQNFDVCKSGDYRLSWTSERIYKTWCTVVAHPRGGGGAAGLQPPETSQNRNLKNTDFVDMISKFYVIYPSAEIGWWLVH